MTQKSYYVGVLLSASKNPLNKIQFFIKEKSNGLFELFSRNRNFSSDPDPKKMKRLGSFKTVNECVNTIVSGKKEMRARGITVPGVEILFVD